MTAMPTSTAWYLDELGADPSLVPEENRRQLDEDGYTVLRQLMTPAQIAAIKESLQRIGEAEGVMAGAEYMLCDDGAFRLHNLLNKDDVYDFCLTHPLVLASIRHILGAFRLSMLNMRSQLPGQKRQKLHVDWYDGAVGADGFKVADAMWLLDPFTVENGATRVVPGSHLATTVPKQELADGYQSWPGELQVTADAGDVIVFNSHLWHGGMDNRSPAPRAAINTFFCRSDQKPEMDQNTLLDRPARDRVGRAARGLLGLEPAPES